MTVQERKERNLRKRRRQAAKRNMVILLVTVLLITIGSVFFGSSFSSAKNDVEYERLYKSIEIQKGDSLWNIAKEYRPDGCSTKQFVDELMELNGLTTDTIHEGQYLVVSYYSVAE